MTTKVTVEVSEGADYEVAISMEAPPPYGRTIIYVLPNTVHMIHIRSGMKITGIEELKR